MTEMAGLLMFACILILLMAGFPVAFTFAGVALLFGVIIFGLDKSLIIFSDMPPRLYGLMKNKILMAIPLFIFMGIVLQKTYMAEKLLESMGMLFGRVKAGIAISTVLVGALLAATTGVVGASVVAMGVIALPVMLKNKYSPELSCGVICASGTLGQIIPPSIVLIILADVLNGNALNGSVSNRDLTVSVGDLFKGAVLPGLILVTAYVVYILVYAYVKKDSAPALESTVDAKTRWASSLKAVIPPLILIVLVLGSIFAGIATPTESAAVGGIGSILLALMYKEFTFKRIKESALETVKITGMVFAILIGASAFSLIFTETGAHEVVERLLLSLPGNKWGFIIFSMLAIMILGFFIDFIEISYIIVPILVPIAQKLEINMVWFGILVAMNLQTSFLTPPFGFSLFYLKGVAPPNIKTITIYKGVTAFIFIQVAVLISVVLFPDFFNLTK